MSISTYQNGFKDVVTVRGVPLVTTNPGKVFWVNSTSVRLGGDSGVVAGEDSTSIQSGTYQRPFATIDHAINQCVAARGDVIFVMPGYTETVANATSLVPDVSGVAIIGLGAGTLRPTITLSAVASSIIVSGASSVFQNFLLLAEHDNTIMVEVTGSDIQIVDVECRSRVAATARQFVTGIDVGGASANDCDRVVVSGCKLTSPAVGSTDGIKLSEVSEGVIIENCDIFGDFSVAPVHNPTGKVCTNLTVRDCTLMQLQAADLALELVSACTGALVRNFYGSSVAGIGGVDPGSCRSYECFATDAINVSGALAPTVAT